MPRSENSQARTSRLELRGFGVRYAEGAEVGLVEAVREVDLRIEPGEAVGILGESGCGKSSLALAAFGLSARSARITGEVYLDGQRLTGLDERRWCAIRGRRVGLVFQQPALALHPLRSVGGQLRDVLRAHTRLRRRELPRRQLELFAELELSAEHLDARPFQLSGGQQQRALLALALAGEPSLLVADEPTAALDGETESTVLEVVDRLRRRRGLSLLWISHDPGVLERLCDRLYVMYAGRFVETGPTSSLLAEPRHPYTRALLACRPESTFGRAPLGERRLDSIPGEPPDPRGLGVACAFAPRCSRRLDACDEQPAATADGARSWWCYRPFESPGG